MANVLLYIPACVFVSTPLLSLSRHACLCVFASLRETGTGAFINLPTRQRKSNYDVNEYYRARLQDKNIPGVRKRKVWL